MSAETRRTMTREVWRRRYRVAREHAREYGLLEVSAYKGPFRITAAVLHARRSPEAQP